MSDHVPFEDLSSRLDGELPQVRCDQIDAHLAACDECRAEYESLCWTVGFTRAQPPTPMPKGASLHVPVVAAEPRPVIRLPRLELVFSAVAAIAALALVALVVGSRLPGSQGDQLAMDVSVADRAGQALNEIEGANAPVDVGQSPRTEDSTADGEAADSDGVSSALSAVDESEIATRESIIGEAPAWKVLEKGRIPDPDSESAGYPRPLATAREASLREHGEMAPPPEIGLLQPRRTQASAPAEELTDTIVSAREILRDAGATASVVASDEDGDLRSGASDRPAAGISGVPDRDSQERTDQAPRSPTSRSEGGEPDLVAGSDQAEEAEDADEADEALTDERVLGSGGPAAVEQDDQSAETDDDGEVDDGEVGALAIPPQVVVGESGDSVAEDAELVASAEGSVEETVRAPSGPQATGDASPQRAMPWLALIGLAASLAALSLLLLARNRRQKRYR